MAIIDNLISYWKLDEVAGNAIDAHDAHDGTVTGATQGAAGKINTAYSFDGNDDVDMGDVTWGIANAFSIQAWIYPTTIAGDDRQIVGIDGGGGEIRRLQFRIDNGVSPQPIRVVRFDSGDNIVTNFASATEVAENEWAHVVITFNTTDGTKIYINGVLDDNSDADTTANGDGGENTFIGARASGIRVDQFIGTIDEVAIFNADIGQAGVTELWANGQGNPYPFVVGTNMKINIGDVWKDVDSMKINIGDVWKDVVKVQINIGDVWKTVFG